MYSERTGLHKLLRKQTFESDFQPENQEKTVRNTNTQSSFSLEVRINNPINIECKYPFT